MTHPGLHYIRTVGIPGLVKGLETGLVPFEKAFAALGAVSDVIDVYDRGLSCGNALTDLRRVIDGLPTPGNANPEEKGRIIDLFTTRSKAIEVAARMEMQIDAVSRAADGGAALVVGFGGPLDLGAEMRWIPRGEFQMGSQEDDPFAEDCEKPLRTVMSGGFFMPDHLVTDAEFKRFLDVKGRKDVRDLPQGFAGGDQPAVCVDHEDAKAYAAWLGEEVSGRAGVSVIGMLPTEEEWEKAAKGPLGDEFVTPATQEQAHFDAKTTRAVNHPDAMPNGYGLKDMIGNVYEWTESLWMEGLSLFVIRGASWNYRNCRHVLRAAFRNYYRDADVTIGFRPILVPQSLK